MDQIAARSNLTASRADYVLKELIALKIVDRIVRLGDRPGAKFVRYRCADPMTNFWFRLTRPNRGYATQAGAQRAYDERIAPRIADLMGPLFERIVGQAIEAGCLGVSPSNLAPYWSRDGKTDVDLVAETPSGNWFVECKWRPDGELDIGDLNQLREHAARTGIDTSGCHLVLATAGSFSKRLKSVAKAEDVTLLDLAALFGHEKGSEKPYRPQSKRSADKRSR